MQVLWHMLYVRHWEFRTIGLNFKHETQESQVSKDQYGREYNNRFIFFLYNIARKSTVFF